MSRRRGAIFSVLALTILLVSVFPGGAAMAGQSSQPGTPLQQSQVGGIQQCTACHFEGAGANTSIRTDTCYECHPNSTTFHTPFKQETIHSSHQDTEVPLTNLTLPDTHPELESREMFRCSRCHKTDGLSCTNCHDTPHGPERTDCTGCHQTPPDLFAHDVSRVESGHEGFNCTVCHDSATSLLERINGKQLSLGDSADLCWQCHSTTYDKWLDGNHHTEAFDPDEKIVHGNVVNTEEVRKQKRAWMRDHSCIKCHDPHAPSVNATVSEIPEGGDTGDFELPSFKQYIPGLDVIALILAVLVFLIGMGFELQRGLLAELGVDITSILDRILAGITHPIALIRGLPGRTKIVLLMVMLSLVFFKAAFGVFVPFMVVESDSMEPNINKGDVVVYVDYDSGETIHTYNASVNAEGIPYTSFGAYGDVIIFETNSKPQPVVHRAMRWVDEGDPIEEGDKPAPAPGYVTKGDNNDRYDPNTPLLDRPLPDKQIRGVALYRIPAIGWVRLLLPV